MPSPPVHQVAYNINERANDPDSDEPRSSDSRPQRTQLQAAAILEPEITRQNPEEQKQKMFAGR